jgi:hypothetical protein
MRTMPMTFGMINKKMLVLEKMFVLKLKVLIGCGNRI